MAPANARRDLITSLQARQRDANRFNVCSECIALILKGEHHGEMCQIHTPGSECYTAERFFGMLDILDPKIQASARVAFKAVRKVQWQLDDDNLFVDQPQSPAQHQACPNGEPDEIVQTSKRALHNAIVAEFVGKPLLLLQPPGPDGVFYIGYPGLRFRCHAAAPNN